MSAAGPADGDPAAPPDGGATAATLRALESWMRARDWRSYDPYDALASPLLRPLVAWPLAARLCTQLVKRSPLNLRPLLGVRPALYTKTVSDLLSAYLRLHAIQGHDADLAQARRFRDDLRARALSGYPGTCFGMDLTYVSRFTTATPATPNLFQTVNAGVALLDAYQAWREPQDLELALGIVTFLEKGLGKLVDTPEQVAWRYYPGKAACVYNVNALVGALLLDLSLHASREDLWDLGRRTLAFVVASQNPDGSWYYARGSEGGWIDGFHTGYVLESLLHAAPILAAPVLDAALERGRRFYVERLFTPDGVPRYTASSTYPIEVQNCAEAVQALSRFALRDAAMLPLAQKVARRVQALLFRRRGDGGYFVAGRGRFAVQRVPYIRWGQAPMFLAWTYLLEAEHAAIAPAAEKP